ncbi:ABC transporter permease [Agathobacter sp.]
MFNAIRMDLYRLIHTKSTYVILVIAILLALATTGVTALFMNMIEEAKNEATEYSQETESASYASEETADDTGLTFTVNDLDEEDIEAADSEVKITNMIVSDISGIDVGLLLAIFAVMFSTADINSGYIKSVGGQVKSRGLLITSKMAALAVFTLVTFIVDAIAQCIATPLLIHGAIVGDVAEMFKILGVQYIMNVSLAFFIMSIAIIIKNNVISMIISVCMCTGIFGLIFNGINLLISKAGVENFDINNYIIINKITSIDMNATGKDIGSAIVVSVLWAVVGLVAVYNVFKRRDI